MGGCILLVTPPFCYYFLISELTIIVYNLVLSVKSVPESVFG